MLLARFRALQICQLQVEVLRQRRQVQSHTLSSTKPSTKSSTKSSTTLSGTKSRIPQSGRGPQSLANSAESCGRNSSTLRGGAHQLVTTAGPLGGTGRTLFNLARRTGWWRPAAHSLLANGAESCGIMVGNGSTVRGGAHRCGGILWSIPIGEKGPAQPLLAISAEGATAPETIQPPQTAYTNRCYPRRVYS